MKKDGCCQFLNLKSSPSIIQSQQKQPFSHFVLLKVVLFLERFEEHKSLFKLDGCFLQSINLCLANILPKNFEVWGFPYIFVTFRNTFGLLEYT